MKHVLWIDDQPIRFTKIRHLLERRYLTLVFAHGDEQCDFYLRRVPYPWDLIILDHDMPLMSGMLVAEKFLVELSIPVLLCSNNPSGRGKQKALLEEYGVPIVDCDIMRNDFGDIVENLLWGGEDGKGS